MVNLLTWLFLVVLFFCFCIGFCLFHCPPVKSEFVLSLCASWSGPWRDALASGGQPRLLFSPPVMHRCCIHPSMLWQQQNGVCGCSVVEVPRCTLRVYDKCVFLTGQRSYSRSRWKSRWQWVRVVCRTHPFRVFDVQRASRLNDLDQH